VGAGVAPGEGAAMGRSTGAGTDAEACIAVDPTVDGAVDEVCWADEVVLAGILGCKNAIQLLYEASALEQL
jgi:hypothetical protein